MGGRTSRALNHAPANQSLGAPAGRRSGPALSAPALITHNLWEQGGARIIFANPAFCRLTGYSAKELAGQNTRLLHGPKTDLTLLRLGRRDGPSDHAGSGEGWLCRKDGTPFFAQ
ncbi:MAG: PAS domain S-box protein [Lacunisphaera sp.]|nr:PAS domain S-box protein [Lacunisphaera sp.]